MLLIHLHRLSAVNLIMASSRNVYLVALIFNHVASILHPLDALVRRH